MAIMLVCPRILIPLANVLRKIVCERLNRAPQGHFEVLQIMDLHFAQLIRTLLKNLIFSLTRVATAREISSRGAPPPRLQVTLLQVVVSPRPCSPCSEHKTTWLRRLSNSWLQLEVNSAVVKAARTVEVATVTGAGVSGGPGGPWPFSGCLGPLLGCIGPARLTWPFARLSWPWLPGAVARAGSSSGAGRRGSVSSSPADTWRSVSTSSGCMGLFSAPSLSWLLSAITLGSGRC